MASDFFIEESDAWRNEAWDFIRCRPDVTFSLLTKRAERIEDCLPSDWGDGWDNVSFSVSCENQKRLEERMPYLLNLPANHRWVSLKPFIGEVDIAPYLATGKIETVLAGCENYLGSRPLHYEWVKKVYDACVENNVQFIFGRPVISLLKTAKNIKSVTAQNRWFRRLEVVSIILQKISKQRLMPF